MSIKLSDKACIFITDEFTTFESNNVHIGVQIQEEMRSNGVQDIPFFYEINISSISDINIIGNHLENLSYMRKNFDCTVYVLLGSTQIANGLDPFQFESTLRRIILDLSHFEFDCYIAFPNSWDLHSDEIRNRITKIRSIVSSLCEEAFERKFYITYMYDDNMKMVSNLHLIKKSIASHFCKVNKIKLVEESYNG